MGKPLDGGGCRVYRTCMNLERKINRALRNLTFGDLPALSDAKRAYASERAALGFREVAGAWMSAPSDVAKYREGEGRVIYGMALAAHKASGHNVCLWEDHCAKACVAKSGNGGYPAVTAARIARTNLWANDPAAALTLLVRGMDNAVRAHGTLNVAARLNTFSDIRWERVLPFWFWTRFGFVKFYDYTKAPLRARPVATVPGNYSLTYSVSSRSTQEEIAAQRAAGRSVAVVVETRGGIDRRTGDKRPLPTVMSANVVDGDRDDRRYADPEGAIVMLRRKGSLSAGDSLVRDPRSI